MELHLKFHYMPLQHVVKVQGLYFAQGIKHKVHMLRQFYFTLKRVLNDGTQESNRRHHVRL
jgi:hypothetical protein